MGNSMLLYQKICDVQFTQNIDEMLIGSTMTDGINLVLKINETFYYPKGSFVKELDSADLTASSYHLIEVTMEDFADAANTLVEANLFVDLMIEKPEWLMGAYLKLMNSKGQDNG